MYIVQVKEARQEDYKEVARFKDYKKAYYHTGEMLADNSDLHWSYSLKYMMDGYNKNKLFIHGATFIKRDGICYKITQPKVL